MPRNSRCRYQLSSCRPIRSIAALPRPLLWGQEESTRQQSGAEVELNRPLVGKAAGVVEVAAGLLWREN